MTIQECNPYIRAAEIHPAVLEGSGLRMAYDYRLFYILENKGSVILQSNCYEVCPDTLIIIPPATAYDFRGKMKVVVLNFDMTRRYAHRSAPLFPPCVDAFDPSMLFETELLAGFEGPCVLPGDLSTREAVLQIVNRFNTGGGHVEAAISAMVKLLLAELLGRDTDAADKLSQEILSYIRIHAADIHRNEDVAQAFGYHPVYISDLLRRTTGKTLHTAVMDSKLQLACKWLTGTNESIDEIAHLCGFCSRTHFCTLFKKKLSVSPTQYRKNHSFCRI